MNLVDVYHDMTVRIDVAGGRIVAIDGHMARFPATTCPGATDALTDMLDLPVVGSASHLRAAAASRHCTHLRDSAVLALAALERDDPDFVTDIAVTDADEEGRQHLEMRTNGAVRLDLDLRDMAITAPDRYAGRSMFGGFNRWVNATFEGREADEWRMAQIAFFVSRGRRWLVDGATRVPVGAEPDREGVCHTFSRPSFPDALSMVGFTRDFTEGLPTVDVDS